ISVLITFGSTKWCIAMRGCRRGRLWVKILSPLAHPKGPTGTTVDPQTVCPPPQMRRLTLDVATRVARMGRAEPQTRRASRGHHREAFVGIEPSKSRTAVAIAEGGRGGELRYFGEFPATEAAMKLVAKLASKYRHLTLCSRQALQDTGRTV